MRSKYYHIIIIVIPWVDTITIFRYSWCVFGILGARHLVWSETTATGGQYLAVSSGHCWTRNESGYLGPVGVFLAAAMAATAVAANVVVAPSLTGGDVVSGVVCSDRDNGTAAAPAAAPDGVLIRAECRLSVTDLYRWGLVLWHWHLSNLKQSVRDGNI